MKHWITTALVLGTLGMAGCASIAGGTKQNITVTSNVPGAQVVLDGAVVGVTPFTGSVPRGSNKSLVIQMNGYAPQTLPMPTTITGMFWGNILIGGTTGSTTDMASGAAYEYSPATFYVDLISAGGASLDQQKDAEIKQFAMIHFDAISRDVANGQGDYLKSMCLMVSGKDDASSRDLVKKILVESKGDVVRFGETLATQRTLG